MSVRELNFYQNLHEIRNRELQRIKNKTFQNWVNHYEEHLDEMYEIFLTHEYISYEDFVQLMYDCTLPIYDFKTKTYKKYLI